MKRMRTSRLLALVLITSILWVSSVCAEDMVTITTIYQGVTVFDFKVSCDTIKKQPKWEGEGLPPLSLDNALKSAKGVVDCSNKKLQTVELSRIVDLKSLSDDTNWYYKITFSSKDAKFPEDVVILFDGTAILPQRVTSASVRSRSP